MPNVFGQIFQCFYCGEWFCKDCAKIHFGRIIEKFIEGGGI